MSTAGELDRRVTMPRPDAPEFRPTPIDGSMTLMRASHEAIDWKVLRLLAAQLDDTVVVSILNAYSEQLAMRADALRAASGPGGTALRDAAHALTASSLTIGALRLGHLCRDIESCVERGDDDQARTITTKALAEMDDVAAALRDSPWHVSTG